MIIIGRLQRTVSHSSKRRLIPPGFRTVDVGVVELSNVVPEIRRGHIVTQSLGYLATLLGVNVLSVMVLNFDGIFYNVAS